MKFQLELLLNKDFWLSKQILWLFFIVNALGTVYGYQWYWNQLKWTFAEKPIWTLPFVPDSPTASLFFTIAILWLIVRGTTPSSGIRRLIEALAVITSIKYGIWAVAMIAAGIYQGDTVSWTDWMLSFSHIGMAIEVLLFCRFFSFRFIHIIIAALWTLSNDLVDYTMGVFPYLDRNLYDDLTAVQWFTVGLSLFAIGCAVLAHKYLTIRDH